MPHITIKQNEPDRKTRWLVSWSWCDAVAAAFTGCRVPLLRLYCIACFFPRKQAMCFVFSFLRTVNTEFKNILPQSLPGDLAVLRIDFNTDEFPAHQASHLCRCAAA